MSRSSTGRSISRALDAPDPYVTARSHGLRVSGYHDGAVQPARRPWGEISRAGGAKHRGKRAPAIGTPTTARPSVRQHARRHRTCTTAVVRYHLPVLSASLAVVPSRAHP